MNLYFRFIRRRNREEANNNEQDFDSSLSKRTHDMLSRIIISIYDYTFIAWYLIVERVRNIFSGFSWIFSIGDGTSRAAVDLISRHQERRRIKRGNSTMPDLEVDACLSPSIDIQCKHNTINTLNELQPAFLKEKEFPKGWMVYHPTLGVVLKSVADEFNHDNIETRNSNKLVTYQRDKNENIDMSDMNSGCEISNGESNRLLTMPVLTDHNRETDACTAQNQIPECEHTPLIPVLKSITAS